MNYLDLVVPGLCGPLPDISGVQENPVLTSLIKLLSRADRIQSDAFDFHSELSALFGFDPRQALPSAALTLLGCTQERTEGFWFHLDPVHLQADMDHALLRDSSSLDLDKVESESLMNEVNQHFFEEGIRLISTDENHWFLNSHQHNDIKTSALHDVIGCNVNFHMPQGKDEVFWKQFLNETQMLLHSSDTNQRREESGQLAINSLWLWGGGELPEMPKKIDRPVFSNHDLVKGLALLCQSAHTTLTNAQDVFKSLDEKYSPIVVVDDVFVPACYGDVNVWQQALTNTYEQWIEPIVDYSLARKMTIRLHPCNGTRYVISARNKFRIFRKNNFSQHISEHG